jgi:hypothetical protein
MNNEKVRERKIGGKGKYIKKLERKKKLDKTKKNNKECKSKILM